MNLRGRIERLENHHALKDDTVTLSELVAYSYRKDTDPPDLELEERISRSRLGRMLSEARFRLPPLAGGPAGEVNQERGGAHV